MTSPAFEELSCGVLVFNLSNEVLLLRHSAGHWAFPKGHQEAGESDRETALRELREETGLACTLLSDEVFTTSYSPASGVAKEVRYFLAATATDNPELRLQAAEIREAAWLPFPRAAARLTFANDRALLQNAFNRYLSLRVEADGFKPAQLLANTLRPAPADLPVQDVHTPAFIVDTRLLEDHLRLLARLRRETGCRILLAQKAYSCFPTYPLLAQYLDGTTASGLHEAELGYREMPGREVHVFSPAFKPAELTRLLVIAGHLIFNSFSQWTRYRDEVRAHNAEQLRRGLPTVSCGLRINPEFSMVEHDLYNPAAPGSRLGIPYKAFVEGVERFGLDGIEGLHFHTLCEENSDSLAATWQVVKERFGPWLADMKWINMGGGHHITRDDYDLDLLRTVIRDAQASFGAQVYLEPGEAVVLNCGWLVSEVQDLLRNQLDLAILDTSAICHMPDVLEMPYQPKVFTVSSADAEAFRVASTSADESKPHLYRLGGPTCLAGDVIGDYAFSEPLAIGDRLVFCDMALYTIVKTNTFNGMPLPSIYLYGDDGLQLVKEFGYEDFRGRLG